MSKIIREAAVLTSGWVTSDSFSAPDADVLQLLVSFTRGRSGGCRIKIEFSEDETNWYRESLASEPSSGCTYVEHVPMTREIEYSANLVIPVPSCRHHFFRISAHAYGFCEGTSLSILATW